VVTGIDVTRILADVQARKVTQYPEQIIVIPDEYGSPDVANEYRLTVLRLLSRDWVMPTGDGDGRGLVLRLTSIGEQRLIEAQQKAGVR